MRKDKLDEIKNILNYESEIYFLKRNEVIPYHKITKENLKWLIEQVKRVQELEEQNKRYREAIEKALACLQNIKFASPDVESCSKVYSAIIGLNCALDSEVKGKGE